MNEVTTAIVKDLLIRVEILEAQVKTRKPRAYKHQIEYDECLDIKVNGSAAFEVDEDAKKPLATSLLNRLHSRTDMKFTSNITPTAAILVRRS